MDRTKLIKSAVLCVAVINLLLLSLVVARKSGLLSVFFNSNNYMPIYSVDVEEKKISLSFDTAWGNEDTQFLLDTLAKYKVKATFFLVGGWASRYPDDVMRLLNAGHDLGNHSENHKHMPKLTKDECKQEIMIAHQKVKDITGTNMNLFRVPYGDYNETVLEAAKECLYTVIQWDVDSHDWMGLSEDELVDRVLNHNNLQNGSIILMHSNADYTAEALERIILGLQEQGYTLVPISELIYKEEFYIDDTGRQISNIK